MASHDIAGLAQLCQVAITDLHSYVQDVEMSEWPIHQASSLNVWIDTLGVYAGYHSSIACNLSNNDPIAMMICQQLRALQGNFKIIQRAILSELTALANALPSHTTRDGIEEGPPLSSNFGDHRGNDDDNSHVNSGNSDRTRAERVGGSNIKEGIARQQRDIEARLRRLTFAATMIRRGSKVISPTKSGDAASVGDDFKDLESEFMEFIDKRMLEAFGVARDLPAGVTALDARPGKVAQIQATPRRYHVPDHLRERLRATMLKRWIRLSHQLSVNAVLARHADSAGVMKDPFEAGHHPEDLETTPVTPLEEMSEVVQKGGISPSRISRKTTTDTRADVSIPESVDDGLQGAFNFVPTLGRTETSRFPPEPYLVQDALVCSLCGFTQSKRLVDDKKVWQGHAMRDLSPYFCVLEACPEPLNTYQTTEEWLIHCNNAHSQETWHCSLCPPGMPIILQNSDDHRQHLVEKHADSGLTQAVMDFMTDMSRRQSSPRPTHCVFCGLEPRSAQAHLTDDDLQRVLAEHMSKQHFQTFALDCMPWDVAERTKVKQTTGHRKAASIV
jgi:hypothetical protein